MTLKSTKPLQFQIMHAFKDSDGNTIIFIKAKKALIQRSVFLKPPTNIIETPLICFRLVYTMINNEVVGQVLMTQVATKTHSSNKINF